MERTCFGLKLQHVRVSAKAKKCQWASLNPGKTVFPWQSMTLDLLPLSSSRSLVSPMCSTLPLWTATREARGYPGSKVIIFALTRMRSEIDRSFVANSLS